MVDIYDYLYTNKADSEYIKQNHIQNLH